MAQVKRSSRRLALALAFVSVMSAMGGLLGAIAGVVLVLLTQTVLDVAPSTFIFMPAGMGVGVVVSMCLGIVLMTRPGPAPLALQPQVGATPPQAESNMQ